MRQKIEITPIGFQIHYTDRKRILKSFVLFRKFIFAQYVSPLTFLATPKVFVKENLPFILKP